MSFNNEIKQQAMVACGRHCCICHKFCGNNMEVHHIKAHADGGNDTFENAIPLCFDCHAEVRQYDPKHPKGIKFTEQELIQHRNRWYSQVEAGICKQNHAPERIPVDPIKIVRQNGYQDILLHRVTSGQELFSYAQGASAMEYNYDELSSREEAVVVSNFVQQVAEIIDCDYFAVEPSDYIMYGFEFNSVIKSLEENGFWVFCGREKRKISGGVTAPADFPTLLLQIKRKDSQDIIAIGEDS